jgi:hypothetical protein
MSVTCFSVRLFLAASAGYYQIRFIHAKLLISRIGRIILSYILPNQLNYWLNSCHNLQVEIEPETIKK